LGGYVSSEKFETIWRDRDVDAAFIARLRRPEVTRVQIETRLVRSIKKETWKSLEKHVFARRALPLRLYGHSPVDLRFLALVPSLEHLALEAGSLSHVETARELHALQRVDLSLVDRASFDVLEHLRPDLRHLAIWPESPSASPRDAAAFEKFTRLVRLDLKYCAKGLDAFLDRQDALEELTLAAMKLPNVDAIGRRSTLRKLAIKACSVKSFDALTDAKELRFLQLWKTTNANVDFIGEMPGLQFAYLQTVNNVRAFPKVTRARKLGRIVLVALRRMRDFRTLANVASLRELAFMRMVEQKPRDFLPILQNPNVEAVTLHSAKKSVREEAEALVAKHGKDARRVSFLRDDFAYVD
jgi:hypothetical protein